MHLNLVFAQLTQSENINRNSWNIRPTLFDWPVPCHQRTI